MNPIPEKGKGPGFPPCYTMVLVVRIAHHRVAGTFFPQLSGAETESPRERTACDLPEVTLYLEARWRLTLAFFLDPQAACLQDREERKKEMSMCGAPARNLVMHQGHSCIVWFDISYRGRSLNLCWARVPPPLLDLLWELPPIPYTPARWAASRGRRPSLTLKQDSATANPKQHLTEITNICLGVSIFFFPHQGLGRAIISRLSSITFFHIFCIFPQNHFAGTTERSLEIIWWLLQIQPLTLQALRDENCLKSTVVYPVCTSGLLSRGENANRGDI